MAKPIAARSILLAPILAAGVVAALLLPLASVFAAQGSNSGGYENYLVVYGTLRCPHCRALKSFLEHYFPGVMTFCPVEDEECREKLALLYTSGVTTGYPTTVVCTGDGRIVAIVVGEYPDRAFWEKILSTPKNGTLVPVYYLGRIAKYYSPGSLGVEEWLCGEKEEKPGGAPATSSPVAGAGAETGVVGGGGKEGASRGFADIVAALLVLAAVDSLNPCTVYLYTAFLLAVIARSGGDRREIVASSTGFIAAVYASYYALGVGLLYATMAVPRWGAGLVALVASAYMVYTGVRAKPRILAPRWASRRAVGAATGFTAGLGLGLLLSWTLLPCSSGPYFVFTSLASKLSPMAAYPLLALYNAVFVLPFVAVSLLALRAARVREIRMWMRRRQKEVSVASGLLLAALGVYLLL